jgi:hypothetical protein
LSRHRLEPSGRRRAVVRGRRRSLKRKAGFMVKVDGSETSGLTLAYGDDDDLTNSGLWRVFKLPETQRFY